MAIGFPDWWVNVKKANVKKRIEKGGLIALARGL
jgi:hypothetical protein